MAFSAVGSLREEVKPRDFCVGGGVVDWTKGVSEGTFSSSHSLIVERELRKRKGEREGKGEGLS